MQWLVFTYSLPSKGSSSPRVTLWRRLRRLGAVTPTGGLYLLPERDDCVEALQWLAQEIHQAQGDAMVFHVTHIEGFTDQQAVALFQAARSEEYAELDQQASALEQQIHAGLELAEREQLLEALSKLRRRYTDIARVDYFDCPYGAQVSARLASITRALAPSGAQPEAIVPAHLVQYREVRWVTRPRPHVDRLACAWLIRRFINPQAEIRYATQPEPDEVTFDMPDAYFGHHGNLCTFETMLLAFGFDDPALRAIAEIVHEIDVRDGMIVRPETAGIDVILQGWLLIDLTDGEREARGIALFEGLHAGLAATPAYQEMQEDQRTP